jgi:hypothetical protein
MCVLDMGGYVPGAGRVVRIDPNGSVTQIADGLDHPTGLTIGPDGALYVSNHGFGYCSYGQCPADGTIVKITLDS